MNRLIALSAVLLLCAPAAADDKKEVPKDLVPFQGEWKIVKALNDGGPSAFGGGQVVFAGDQMTLKLSDNSELGTDTVSVNPKADPAELNWGSKKGDRTLCIYKFDKDGKLVICMGTAFTFADGEVARPTKFDSKVNTTLLVLEKVKK